MDDELNYDSLRLSQPLKLSQTRILKPKVFSLAQSANQRENLVLNSAGKRDRPPFSENTKAFRPARLLGGDQNAKRPPIFPALQRFQKSENQQPRPQEPQSSTTQFFSLLKPSTAAPASTPADVCFSHPLPARSVESSPHRDHEPSSDKDLPLSPSPQSRAAHTPHLQMLPPRSPLVLPISRPESRARSQSHSSASLHNDEVTLNVDHSTDLSTPSKSKGLPDIAINVLRELQVVNDELVGERRHTQSILNQLNALSTAHEALTSNYNMRQQEMVSVQRELDAAKHEVRDIQGNLALVNDSKEKTQKELDKMLEQLGNARNELKAEREERMCKMAGVRERLVDLGTNYAQLQTSFQSLKLSYDASQALLSEMRHVRGWAADGLRTLEPLLDAANNYTRAGELKMVLGELQDELAGSHRVNDLLRDKLHHQSSQLAETRDRVRELEEAEKGRLGEIVAILGGTGSGGDGVAFNGGGLVQKIREVVERLVKHEHDTVEVRAEAAAAEARSVALMERLEEVKRTLALREKEVEDLRGVQDANRALASRVQELEAMEESMRQTTLELKVANSALQARDKELFILQSELAELKSGKAKLQALLSEAQATAKLAEDDTKNAQKSRVEESCKLGEMQGRCEFLEMELGKVRKECEEAKKVGLKTGLLEAELENVKKEAAEREDTFRQAENRLIVLQERFDAQTITLRLAKEHGGDLQERLLVSESSFASKFACITGKHETELSVLQERNANLQRMVDSLKQDYASKQAALVSSAAEFEKKMGKQEAAAERLIKLETKRADAAEREAAGARRQVEEERLTNGELRKRIGVIEGERRYVEEEGRRMVVDAEGAKDGLLVSMKEKMAELERINKDLVVQCRTLRERYEKNDLTDEEKDFVDWLQRVCQSLHEQEDVAKENELRRRENMNSALQARIHELESTLARLLHERGREDGGQPKSMVDLTMWMSSPDHALKAVASHSSAETPRGSRIIALPLAVSAVTSSATIDPALLALPSFATTAISVPDAAPSSAPRVTNKPIPKSKMSKLTGVNETKVTTSRTTQKSKATKTFSTLAASDFDSDSEDDTPLSELSDYLSVLGKRARAVSPAKVEKPRVTRRSRATTKVADEAPQPSPPSAPTSVPGQRKTEGNVKIKQKKRKV